MEKEKIERIGKIIAESFYGPLNGISEKEHEKLIDDYCIDIETIDEDENECYGVAKSDSLFVIYIKDECYLVDVPWNKFYPYNEPLPDLVPAKGKPDGWYEYLGGWYEF